VVARHVIIYQRSTGAITAPHEDLEHIVIRPQGVLPHRCGRVRVGLILYLI
jgi:hypothetical protein